MLTMHYHSCKRRLMPERTLWAQTTPQHLALLTTLPLFCLRCVGINTDCHLTAWQLLKPTTCGVDARLVRRSEVNWTRHCRFMKSTSGC